MFLQVLTRCYRRPTMLTANIASLEAQTDPDWTQTCLVDSVGRGIGWSHENMAAYAPLLRGDYIWILDDDDLCIQPTLVAELKSIAQESKPDVIMLRMDHGKRGVLPDDEHWRKPPKHGYIGSSAFVVRRSLWQQHAGEWGQPYESDYRFIAAIYADKPNIYWHDLIASRVQRISRGNPE